MSGYPEWRHRWDHAGGWPPTCDDITILLAEIDRLTGRQLCPPVADSGSSEFGVRKLPDGKRLILWRNPEHSAVWLHVAVVDRLEDVSAAMVNHRDNQATR